MSSVWRLLIALSLVVCDCYAPAQDASGAEKTKTGGHGMAGAEICLSVRAQQWAAIIKLDGSGILSFGSPAGVYLPPESFDPDPVARCLKQIVSHERLDSTAAVYGVWVNYRGEISEGFIKDPVPIEHIFELFRRACREGKGGAESRTIAAAWRKQPPTSISKLWDAEITEEGRKPIGGANQPLTKEKQSVQIREPTFDEVVWCEGKPGTKSTLWLVLTNSGGPEVASRLVVSHAITALHAAKPYDKHDFDIVFFVRSTATSKKGLYTGFDREQLREIANVNGDIAGKCAWSLGILPPGTEKDQKRGHH